MVNPGIKYQFYINPKNDRDCRNWPCKTTQEPCKNIVRVWIVSLMHTLGFPYATSPITHPEWWVNFADGTNLNSPWLRFWVLPISNLFFSSLFRWCECPISELYPISKGNYPYFKFFNGLKQFFSHRTGRKLPDTKKTHLKWLRISPVGSCSAKCVVASTFLPLIGSLWNRRLTKIHFFMKNIPRMIAKRSFLYGPECQQPEVFAVQPKGKNCWSVLPVCLN
jgi:hypothetical protein